jgi:ParB/RepB/Spo0J family partition protein
MTTPTLPPEWRPERLAVPVELVRFEDRDRLRIASRQIDDLADSIAREGLMQPIGVKREGERYVLIWGRRRLECYRRYAGRLGDVIDAEVYPEALPEAWARILERDENLHRQELSPDERAGHTVELARELVLAEEALKSEIPKTPKPGRPKGLVQKVAEREGVDQGTVRYRAQKVAEVIGEPVDLERDPPAELARKAEVYKAKVAEGGGKATRPPRPPKPPKPAPEPELALAEPETAPEPSCSFCGKLAEAVAILIASRRATAAIAAGASRSATS